MWFYEIYYDEGPGYCYMIPNAPDGMNKCVLGDVTGVLYSLYLKTKRMNLVVVVDVELFPNGIVREIGMYRNGTIIGLSFGIPFPYKDLEKWEKRQTKWLTKNPHKIEWSSGEIRYD